MSAPIKVVQIVPRMHEGGVERGVMDLVREHHRSGVAMHQVISEGGRLSAEIIRNGGRFLPLAVAGKNPLTVPSRASKLRAVLAAMAPDIVHVRSRVPAWLHYFANRELGIPTVSTVHGINSVNFYSRIMVAADAIICPSAAVAEHIKRAYMANNVTIIGRGVDLEYFDPVAVDAQAVAALREQWELSGKRVILHVGRLSEQKGHEVLLKALVKLPPDHVALIVGGGKDRRRRQLAALVRKLGVAERARLLGSRRDMRELYALADVVLSCAIKPESFGRTLAEALAMKRPVIATAHGGALDIITADESGGVCVPPADVDALAAALAAPPPVASASRARIQAKFTARRMAEQTLAVYQKLLAQKAGRAE